MKNEWTTTLDAMRSCLEEREKLIKRLISENVELQMENERRNKWLNKISELKGEGQ